MRRVVINIQNKLFCHAISDTLRRSGNELEPHAVLPELMKGFSLLSDGLKEE